MYLLLVCILNLNYPAKKCISDLDVVLEDNREAKEWLDLLKLLS